MANDDPYVKLFGIAAAMFQELAADGKVVLQLHKVTDNMLHARTLQVEADYDKDEITLRLATDADERSESPMERYLSRFAPYHYANLWEEAKEAAKHDCSEEDKKFLKSFNIRPD
jgi:hypothetical protein